MWVSYSKPSNTRHFALIPQQKFCANDSYASSSRNVTFRNRLILSVNALSRAME